MELSPVTWACSRVQGYYSPFFTPLPITLPTPLAALAPAEQAQGGGEVRGKIGHPSWGGGALGSTVFCAPCVDHASLPSAPHIPSAWAVS